jgi:molybdenum cofactor guanylyltransferase
MLGIVLCGGQSSRMGTDKGMIDTNGKRWASVARDKLATLGIAVKFSVNARQVDELPS